MLVVVYLICTFALIPPLARPPQVCLRCSPLLIQLVLRTVESWVGVGSPKTSRAPSLGAVGTATEQHCRQEGVCRMQGLAPADHVQLREPQVLEHAWLAAAFGSWHLLECFSCPPPSSASCSLGPFLTTLMMSHHLISCILLSPEFCFG